MKRETALELLAFYSNAFTQYGAEGTYTQLSNRFAALNPPGSTEKLMRWLGFAQGAACAMAMYTLDSVRDHSREAIAREIS